MLLDGTNIRALPLAWLRRQIGLVSQVRPPPHRKELMHPSVRCTLSCTCPRTCTFAPMGALAALQEPCLFATSIYNNISYGAPEATSDEVYAAARAANCHAFISKLPNG